MAEALIAHVGCALSTEGLEQYAKDSEFSPELLGFSISEHGNHMIKPVFEGLQLCSRGENRVA